MELCDIYDENRVKTGRVHDRSQPLREGEFLLVVGVWIINSHHEWLITKRAPEKRYMPAAGKIPRDMPWQEKPACRPWYANLRKKRAFRPRLRN